jgi:mRNA interferase RelE/StbE
MYEVVVKPSVLRQVRKLELEIQDEIESAIESLAAEPRPDGCKKLKHEDSLYRSVLLESIELSMRLRTRS